MRTFPDEDSGFKFVDDVSMIELVNFMAIDMSSFNVKLQVPSDISVDKQYLHNWNFNTQSHLNTIIKWNELKQMKLNAEKNKEHYDKCLIFDTFPHKTYIGR